MLEIDGSMGEGGGQIVRTALAMSLATQRPFRIANLRANRSRPGLRPQHCTAVEAAATIGRANTSATDASAGHGSSVEVGTSSFTFEPTTVEPGRYQFDVGTAGSAVLVLQTVLPPLLTASAPSTITVTGGTHVRSAPPFEFFAASFGPLVQRMGPVLRATLHRPGFYPKGGGRCTLTVEPVADLQPLDLTERGALRRAEARSIVAHLPRHIAERELATLREGLPVELAETRIETPSARGAGNALLLELAYEHATTLVSGIGEKGTPAEDVAIGVVDAARDALAADAPVDPHLADQLLIPLALGGGRFRTPSLTAHTHTNAAVIEPFVDSRFSVAEEGGGWTISAI
jgi:RNA 3'-terminal phosphate cyclase (ATP)